MEGATNWMLLLAIVAAPACSTGTGGGSGGTKDGGTGDGGGSTCTTDADCPSGDTCDTTMGLCVSPAGGSACATNTDCLPGETCDTALGYCMGTPSTATSCHQCACVDLLSAGGCANVCDMAQNGTTTPNFCNGVSALPQCAKCLMDHCSSITSPPVATDPSACGN